MDVSAVYIEFPNFLLEDFVVAARVARHGLPQFSLPWKCLRDWLIDWFNWADLILVSAMWWATATSKGVAVSVTMSRFAIRSPFIPFWNSRAAHDSWVAAVERLSRLPKKRNWHKQWNDPVSEIYTDFDDFPKIKQDILPLELQLVPSFIYYREVFSRCKRFDWAERFDPDGLLYQTCWDDWHKNHDKPVWIEGEKWRA